MWIPVEFAVPKKPYRVLVKMDFGNGVLVGIAEYYGEGRWEADGSFVKVVAWQPLPE